MMIMMMMMMMMCSGISIVRSVHSGHLCQTFSLPPTVSVCVCMRDVDQHWLAVWLYMSRVYLLQLLPWSLRASALTYPTDSAFNC